MKLSASLAAAALLATASATPEFAAKRHAARTKRLARRHADYHTNPIDPEALRPGPDGSQYGGNTTITQGGPGGWAGAVKASQNDVTQISATVVVPTPEIPPNGSGSTTYGGSAWIGIDGYGTDTLWQTGVTWTVSEYGASFSGWYEWYPAGEVPFQGFNVEPGHVISLNLVATSAVSGTAFITNESTGQSVQHTLQNQPALVKQTAECIVEDFGIGGGSIPFAAFRPNVAFTDCTYTDAYGIQGIAGGTILEVGQEYAPFTSVATDGNDVTISYIGNAANS